MAAEKKPGVFTGPLWTNNPVVVQVLGICSALAVTTQMKPALVMGISLTCVLAFANVIISLLRNTIPNRIRIIVQLVVVAALVILVNQILKAYAFEVSKQLSVYVGLIITNCILMGRLEAFALGNKPWPALLDGLGNGLGYAIILFVVATFREFFGSGTLFGIDVIARFVNESGYDGYQNCGIFVMPTSALILLGCIIWYLRSKNPELQDK
ncbi:MAG: NADH:ubiquinone reductase (Na(+)-transporting) subunit D [Bacteroidales bacterium]|jgi:Na+-transporting NADH:ubiquinone oxidoreductase subunit D|nr:NADH:ubiquinone reductase (Na(+)-transporting) subunit D [Bacteroidales bacterium]MBO7378918.1 NADH:ubiquinone reductase (Na(+)-transporting) subunit D [Bacteroidales bacterium]MBP5214808.1 NADH:ubiquinone reductase (Na(+)-transporting) subunit D [Bacteroidales bacterium]MBP5763857.1 NADH:ubiquinone reductase (Na(+)-transporting) subunit D [Bacteroidales bacterium]